MDFIQIVPEKISALGNRTVFSGADQSQIENLHIQLENWQGGHLMEISSCFVVTRPLAEVLRKSDFTGFEITGLQLNKARCFAGNYSSGISLPAFHWLKVTGKAGKDDFSVDPSNGRLTLSARAFTQLSGAFSLRRLSDEKAASPATSAQEVLASAEEAGISKEKTVRSRKTATAPSPPVSDEVSAVTLRETMQTFLDSIERIGGKVGKLRLSPPATEKEIVRVEKKIGCRLPEDFRNILLTVGRACEFFWCLPDGLKHPREFAKMKSGGIMWSLDRLPGLQADIEHYLQYMREDTEGIFEETDEVLWQQKLAFCGWEDIDFFSFELPGSDYFSLDLSPEAYGRVVYLDYCGLRADKMVLADSFTALLRDWLPLGIPSPENEGWLPFYDAETGKMDPAGVSARKWKKFLSKQVFSGIPQSLPRQREKVEQEEREMVDTFFSGTYPFTADRRNNFLPNPLYLLLYDPYMQKKWKMLFRGRLGASTLLCVAAALCCFLWFDLHQSILLVILLLGIPVGVAYRVSDSFDQKNLSPQAPYLLGKLVPGVIASLDPLRIVVMTETHTDLSVPLWGVRTFRVKELPGHTLRLHEKVPCFVLFNRWEGSGGSLYTAHWDLPGAPPYSVRPLCWAKPDPLYIQRTIRFIDPEDWDRVQQGVYLLKNPPSGVVLPENETLYFDASQQRYNPETLKPDSHPQPFCSDRWQSSGNPTQPDIALHKRDRASLSAPGIHPLPDFPEELLTYVNWSFRKGKYDTLSAFLQDHIGFEKEVVNYYLTLQEEKKEEAKVVATGNDLRSSVLPENNICNVNNPSPLEKFCQATASAPCSYPEETIHTFMYEYEYEEFDPQEEVLHSPQVTIVYSYPDHAMEEDRENSFILKADNEKSFRAGELLFKINNQVADILAAQEYHLFDGLVLSTDNGAADPSTPIYRMNLENKI